MNIALINRLMRSITVDADLRLDCPSGAHLQLSTEQVNTLHLACSGERALWDCFLLARKLGYRPTFRGLGMFRSPLSQTLKVSIAGQTFIRWRPGRFPKVESLRLLLSWLRKY